MRRSMIVTSAALMLGTGVIACSTDSGDRDSDWRADRDSRTQRYDSDRQYNNESRDRSADNDRVRVNPEPSRDTPYQSQNQAYDPAQTTRFHPETDYGHRQDVTTPNGDQDQQYRPGPSNQRQ